MLGRIERCGPFARLYWVFGDVVYNVYSLYSALQCLDIVASSKLYRPVQVGKMPNDAVSE